MAKRPGTVSGMGSKGKKKDMRITTKRDEGVVGLSIPCWGLRKDSQKKSGKIKPNPLWNMSRPKGQNKSSNEKK